MAIPLCLHLSYLLLCSGSQRTSFACYCKKKKKKEIVLTFSSIKLFQFKIQSINWQYSYIKIFEIFDFRFRSDKEKGETNLQLLEFSFSLLVPFVLVGMILESQQLVLRRDLFHLVDKFFNTVYREEKESQRNLIPSASRSYLLNETIKLLIILN